jgi:predicted exporter
VFAVESRASIERDSWRLSVIAAGLVSAILLSVYRSLRIVLLSLLPVLSGLLVGIAVVGLVFGSVHGITLGFGATLIGEAVDYPTYLFTHVAPGESVRDALTRMWPTLRLAVLTTVFGGLTMVLSSFAGLSQLGLLSMTGVLTAGLVTGWVLPALASHRVTDAKRRALPVDWTRMVRSCRRGAWVLWMLVAAALTVLAMNPGGLWDDDLANLSPVPESAKALDQQLRAELGAPDVRYLLVVSGESQEEALARSESAAELLRELIDRKQLTGFEMAGQYLPTRETQMRRRAALPDPATLQAALNDALRGLPFRAGLFTPFLREVEQARTGALMDLAELRGSALSLKIRSLLLHHGNEWVALAPLRGVTNGTQLAARIEGRADPHVFLLDLKEESNRLVNGYRNESLRLTALGVVSIALLLWWGLRDPSKVVRVLLPVLMAVVLVVAVLTMLGERLSLFHLVSLLLVIGIGLNYALFFNRDPSEAADTQRTALSLTVCGLATLSAFGALAFSRTPVLHAIGLTVSLGSLFSLLTSAVLSKGQACARSS